MCSSVSDNLDILGDDVAVTDNVTDSSSMLLTIAHHNRILPKNRKGIKSFVVERHGQYGHQQLCILLVFSSLRLSIYCNDEILQTAVMQKRKSLDTREKNMYSIKNMFDLFMLIPKLCLVMIGYYCKAVKKGLSVVLE